MNDTEDLIRTGIRVSLTKTEYAIIQEDMKSFRNNLNGKDFKFGKSVFLHRIFLSYLKTKYEQYPDISLILKWETEDGFQKEKERKRNNTQGVKISLNRKITIILEEAIHYNQVDAASKTFGELSAKYFTYFIKKYTLLPQPEREQIFYHELFEELNDCIALKQIIKLRRIKSKGTFIRNPEEENGTDGMITMLPYRIEYSKDSDHYYIAGFELQLNGDGSYHCSRLYSVPIYKILPFDSDSIFYRLDKAKINSKSSKIHNFHDFELRLKNRLNQDGILYISDEINQVKVKLTDKGIEMMLGRDKYRPHNIKQDDDDKHIVTFDATRFQTFQFFFKFGAEAEVLEPKEYREFFCEKFYEALKVYNPYVIMQKCDT